MQLTVADVSADAIRNEGSIIVLEGINEAGKVIWFAADWRPALEIIAIVQDEGELVVEIEPWQIVGTLS